MQLILIELIQYLKSVPSNFSIPKALPSSLAIASTLTLVLIPLVGSQIILSIILTIQNNNHTQEYKIYVENSFSLKGKTTGQTPNNFTIYQINYNNSCICLTVKEKSLLFSFALTHTFFVSQRQQHFAPSSLTVSSMVVTLYSLLFGYLIEGGNILLSLSSCVPPKRKSFFSLSWFHALFSLSSYGGPLDQKPSNSL